MAVSPYFRHTTAENEQSLIDSLTREVIFQRGFDLYYIPRTEDTPDYLFGEDPSNVFDTAVTIEFMLPENTEGWDSTDVVGRFGLDVPDHAVFEVSKSRFIEEMEKTYPAIVRPREGDLIVWVPDVDNDEPMDVFEITFVQKENPFYQIGRSNVFRIDAERFNYSHETMQSGVEDIDTELVPDMDDGFNDSTDIQSESDTFMNFDEDDPFSDGSY